MIVAEWGRRRHRLLPWKQIGGMAGHQFRRRARGVVRLAARGDATS